jgi:hypothetical protein
MGRFIDSSVNYCSSIPILYVFNGTRCKLGMFVYKLLTLSFEPLQSTYILGGFGDSG